MSSHCAQRARRLGRAARAEVPAFTREREQVLVRAGVAADAGEAMLQHAAGEKLVSDLGDDGAESGMRAPGPRSAEHTPTDRAACHRSVARRDVLTHHPRGAGLVVSHDRVKFLTS